MRVNNLGLQRTYNNEGHLKRLPYKIQNYQISTKPEKNDYSLTTKNYVDYTDSELVDSYVLDIDELAFEEIFNRYYHNVKKLGLKILNDVEEAEDLVQEVFVNLLTSMSGFHGESKFSSWLYLITLNIIRMKLRENLLKHLSHYPGDDNLSALNKQRKNIIKKRNIHK